MATDWRAVDAAFHDALRKHYSDDEIVELGSFIGFNIGYHTFFGTLKFYPMFSPDGRLLSQEESRRLYGANPVSLSSANPVSPSSANRVSPSSANAGSPGGSNTRKEAA